MFYMLLLFLIDFYHCPASQVEHVTREEKTITAYDLIETYCELIVARMAIIESQKYVLLKTCTILAFSGFLGFKDRFMLIDYYPDTSIL